MTNGARGLTKTLKLRVTSRDKQITVSRRQLTVHGVESRGGLQEETQMNLFSELLVE